MPRMQFRTGPGLDWREGLAMYAHGTGRGGTKLTVVGHGMEEDFPIHQINKAFSSYHELLRTQGYLR